MTVYHIITTNMVETFIYKLYYTLSTMGFIRVKCIKEKATGKMRAYAYLVENKWIPKKGSRQKVIQYLGKVEGLNPFVAKDVFKRDGFVCQQCGRMDNLTIDHKIPLTSGGSNEPDNLWTLCQRCNKKKGVKPVVKTHKIEGWL